MNRTIVALLFGFVALGACQSAASENEALVVNDAVKTRIDSTLKSFVDSAKVAGVSALVFEKERKFTSMHSAMPTAKRRFLSTVILLCRSSP